jgi:hypothetical protein
MAVCRGADPMETAVFAVALPQHGGEPVREQNTAKREWMCFFLQKLVSLRKELKNF